MLIAVPSAVPSYHLVLGKPDVDLEAMPTSIFLNDDDDDDDDEYMADVGLNRSCLFTKV